MEQFLIISNKCKDSNSEFADKISAYITGRGKKCTVSRADIPKIGDKFKYTNPASVSPTTECIITVGGDGTLIQAAKDLLYVDTVFTGFNLGKLGYLAEINKDNFEQTIESLIKDEYVTEERMMLNGRVVRNGKIIVEDVSLNDIILHRDAKFGMISFKIYVNGSYLSLYDADGVIFSTPTGSTAYNLSAGGPIVKPDAKLILLTPICAHTMNNKSIILSENDEITVKICDNTGKNVLLTFDGDKAVDLRSADRIIITKSKLCTKIAKTGETSFIEILKKKMGNK